MRIPSHEADELDWLLFGQAGVITWRQAAGQLGPARVRHLVATGRWRRLCRGVLVTFTGQLGRDQQLWVAVLAAGDGAVLAGLAAARAGGLRRVPAERGDAIDVLVPVGRRPADLLRRLPPELPAVVVRRTGRLPEQDRQVGRPPRTAMPRSLVDAAQWAITDDEARRFVAAGCQQKLVLPEEVLAVVDRMPKVRRRRLIRQTAQDAAGGAETLAEIDLVRLCRRFRLPVPQRQQRRTDAAGRVRYLDAYWPQWRLHVEVDGAHHQDVGQWEADMRRQNELWVQGDRVLRFPSYLVRRRPAEVADQLRRALLAAGWRP
jgi:very-short-patch-repair endonuclease